MTDLRIGALHPKPGRLVIGIYDLAEVADG